MSWDGIVVFPLALVLAYLVSGSLTPIIAKYHRSIGVVDRPSSRRMHKGEIPRGGGLAIIFGFLTSSILYFSFSKSINSSEFGFNWYVEFLLSSLLIGLIGYIDDIYSLKAKHKLFFQLLVASYVALTYGHFEYLVGVDWPAYLDFIVTVGWLIGVGNAFNLIDGLDGLCTGLGGITFLALGVIELFSGNPLNSFVHFSLASCCLGFVKFNRHPASIFLGDVGSLFIGFSAAALAISSPSYNLYPFSLVGVILIVAIPVCDTSLAIWRRAMRLLLSIYSGARVGGIMDVDTDHLHHRLKRQGYSQGQVASLMHMVAIVCSICGVLGMLNPKLSIGFYGLPVIIGLWSIVRYIAHQELWDSGRFILSQTLAHESQLIFSRLLPLTDALILSISYVYIFRSEHKGLSLIKLIDAKLFATTFLFLCLPILTLLAYLGTYKRVWSHARILEFLLIPLAAVVGLFLGVIISSFFGYKTIGLSFNGIILFSMMSITAMLVVRFIPRGVYDVMTFFRGKVPITIPKRRVLVYGAGMRCSLYLRSLVVASNRNHADEVEIVGIVDDSPALVGKVFQGFKVLGSISDLPQIIQQHEVSEVIVIADIREVAMNWLIQIARHHNLNIYEWAPRLEEIYNSSSKNDGGQPNDRAVGLQ